jgi:hypothetical protein
VERQSSQESVDKELGMMIKYLRELNFSTDHGAEGAISCVFQPFLIERCKAEGPEDGQCLTHMFLY